MPIDAARLFQVSAEGGHAGPSSSWDYIHLVEGAIAHWQRRARPGSWGQLVPGPIDAALFPAIGEGVLLPALKPPVKQPRSPLNAAQPSAGELLALHSEIARRIAAKEEVSAIAGHVEVSREAVEAGVLAIARSLADADLVSSETLNSVHQQVYAIWRHRTWIQAASHEKHAPVAQAINRLVSNDIPGAPHAIWNSWLRCVDGRHIELDRERPASALIAFLLKAGVPRASLAVTSAQQALPLPPSLAAYKLACRRCKARPGAPKYRLALVDRHIKSSGAKARQVSVTGLNWHFVLLGSVLLSKEK